MSEHSEQPVEQEPTSSAEGTDAVEVVETAGGETADSERSEVEAVGGPDEAEADDDGSRGAEDGDESDAESDEDENEAEGEDEDEAGPAAAARSARSGRRAQLEREGEVAADFLETLLDICDLDGDLDVDVDGDRAAVAVVDSDEGRVPRRLVGDNGRVLEALQELTRLAVQSATGDRSRLMLDVAGHRAGRRAALVTLAREAIDSVKSSGDNVALEPMTAFERKVVHDEVLAAGLVSESEGVEPRRHVVILPS